ncbi:multiple epidermal growth factor-like domains protein 10 [Saccostrea cucullata]|uniref:multiple epidermal growth factor-like domains protein 10 n=1 Tax=Saccostrea cuccullata TaxID=36930 RepID=UPI002ED54917
MKDMGIGKGSPEKYFWWSVDLGENYSIYDISIDFKDYTDYVIRQRGRFAGFSLYISNTPRKDDGRLCYKNTLPLPPLEFKTTCIGYGRYVIYYNERLDGVAYPERYQYQSSYTELCEVKIQGCNKAGVYGNNCSIPCPVNCQKQSCNIVNGTCLGCNPGYVGIMCQTECPWRWYGEKCKSECSGHCKGNISCNHVTGNCDAGCAAGWMGEQCDQRCKNGTFGEDCAQNCSIYCFGGTSCNNQNGRCEKGCSPGYRGNLCNDSKSLLHCFWPSM